MSESHFSSRHYEGQSFGPFGFLNPTVRRSPLPLNRRQSQSSEEQPGKVKTGELVPAEGGTTTGNTNKDEIRAEGVQQTWRSRDNRKGQSIILHCH